MGPASPAAHYALGGCVVKLGRKGTNSSFPEEKEATKTWPNSNDSNWATYLNGQKFLLLFYKKEDLALPNLA
jgi:hypothetical protein